MHALLEFLYSTGCRISEALSIKIGNIVDFSGGILSESVIEGKGSIERLIFINDSARIAIYEFLQTKFANQFKDFANLRSGAKSEEFLFSLPGKKDPLSRQRVFQILKQIGLEIGINPDKLSPHIIRHSIAIHLLNGVDENHEEIVADIRLIQEFLGHKSINTTQIYLEYQNYQDLKKVVEQKHPLCNKDFLNQED
jgi:integrase/recombinase XerD